LSGAGGDLHLAVDVRISGTPTWRVQKIKVEEMEKDAMAVAICTTSSDAGTYDVLCRRTGTIVVVNNVGSVS
jgi:hypothetical protein